MILFFTKTEMQEIEVTTTELDNALWKLVMIVELWEDEKQRKRKNDSSACNDGMNEMRKGVVTEGKLIGKVRQ